MGRQIVGTAREPRPFLGPGFAVIAGPCAVESPEQVLRIAEHVRAAGATALRGGAFKPRTSPYTFQGLGRTGVDALADAGRAVGLPTVTEVMDPRDVEYAAARASVIQIGARSMQAFPLLDEVGKARIPALLKRGAGATVSEWLWSAERLLAAGAPSVILCERGIRTFETSTRYTLDLCGALAAKQQTGLPVIVDPSHPAGRADLVAPLILAAAGAGLDGVIVEVHDDPEGALCDGPQALSPAMLTVAVRTARAIAEHAAEVPKLGELRRVIDAIDDAIAGLVERRARVAAKVGEAKALGGLPTLDEGREAAVVERYARRTGSLLGPEASAKIAEAVVTGCRAVVGSINDAP